MQRISLPVGSKSSNVFGAATRRRRYLAGVVSALLLLLFASVASAQSTSQNTISTVAGGPATNNAAPTATPIEGPQGVVRDASGNLYVVNDNGVIYKIPVATAAPVMTIYAGNNVAGFNGDDGPATSALMFEPIGAAVDINGNLYFSDQNNCVVREIVASSGDINTVAGTPGACGYAGDNGRATSAQLNFPQGVAIDGSGNLYIADISNHIIRRVDSSGTITTYAGTPQTPGPPTNNVLATSTTLRAPIAVAVDANGNLFIADENSDVVCRVDVASKIITIVAGTGTFGFSGDGGPATAATMQGPDGVAVDSAENLYISDAENAVVREVFGTGPNAGQIQTIVGNGTFGFSGDGGPALSAELTNPAGLFVDSVTGDLWIADFWSNRIRLYSPGNNKQITTVVGNGLVGDTGQALSASLYYPRSPALDATGNLFIVDAQNNRIRKMDATTKIITTLAGNGIPCAQPQETCGDGGAATSASVFIPRTVTVEPSGDLLIGDGGDNRLRLVHGGTITTVAGSTVANTNNQCTAPFSQCGDGGPATSALLFDPRATVLDSHGNIFFVDSEDNRVRRIDVTTKIITTVAGNGPNGDAGVGCAAGAFSGDGGPAVSANLSCPLGLDIDSHDNLFVSDTFNNRIRRIDSTTQTITTVAGNGNQGFSGDSGLATGASLSQPNRVSVNAAGNYFISDSGNNRIRRVDGTTGIITTFAGNGNFGFSGDGGPALSASFSTPTGVVVDNQGNMYVGDLFSNRIRLVNLNPNVTLSSSTAPFGNQAINVGATPLPVTVTNSGDAPLTISSIALTGASVFSLATSTSPCPVAPAKLAVGAQCVIEVAFTPTQFVASTGTITVTDNGPAANSTQIINVTGTGAAALTVQVTGTGSVTSAPAGITACSTTCTATFTGNSQVALTAAPGTNFTFAGFSANCIPTNALSCTVTMSAAETVNATFTPSGGGGGGLTIHPVTLPNGAVGATYGQVVFASGGTAPLNFTISSGTLPAGLTLGAATGSIGGVPAGPAGPSTFTVHATDSSAPPLSGSASITITIAAADNSNNAELNGSYAFLIKGFNDSDGTMVVVAGSFLANGHGVINSGFEDADGSTGAQPTQEVTGTYVLGADNRGTMTLTTGSGNSTSLAFSVGDIRAGVATKARIIRFDDVTGTTGHTGSGFLLKQDPTQFQLSGIHGSYAFGESGSDTVNGAPQTGVGFLNADGNGNFTPAGLINLNGGAGTGPSQAISGTYALTNETVSNGRLSASVTVPSVSGTVVSSVYVVSSTEFIFISVNAAQNVIYSGTAQLQVPPAGGFDSTSLINNSVVAMQGKQANGSPIVLIGSLVTDGNGLFTLSFVQNNSDTSVTGTAGGTYNVAGNGLAKLTYTSGGFPISVVYLDGVNQGFFAAGDNNASFGTLEPGGGDLNNATISTSGKFFFGTVDPPTSETGDESGVVSIGATTLQASTDVRGINGGLLSDVQGTETYSVAPNGALTFSTDNQGVVGYVASACKIEAVFEGDNNLPILGTFECQQAPASGSTLTVTEPGTGTGTVTSNPTGISCPATTCSASFTSGSQVVLTATPTGGSTFTSFSSNCTAAAPPTNPPTCTVTMTGSPTVNVTFAAPVGPSPVLTISKAHTGNFTQGQQGAKYTVTVSNGAAAGPTSGAVIVTDTIPAGLTLVSMAGTNWTCVANNCTNSTVLVAGASYPVITVTVNVASNAAASVTNAVSVSGGGSATASTTNLTTITTSGGGGGSGIATVNPNPLAFGGVQVGNSSALSFTLQNTGTGPLGNIAISVVTVTDDTFNPPNPVPPDYAITSNTCPSSLAVGSAACTVTVTFTPSFQAPDPGSVVITDDSSAGPTTVLLSGTGAGPVFVLPFEIFYDGQAPGTTSPAQTATLFNTNEDTTVTFGGTTFVGNAASDFAVVNNQCGTDVSAGSNCTMGVTFKPSTTVLGPRTADLTIASNGAGAPYVSHLTGNGAIRHLPGFTANVLPPNDDGSTNEINLPFTMNFFGTNFSSLFVNNNGNVTFGQALDEFTPTGLSSDNGGIPIIAAFWADVDTEGPGSGVATFGNDTVNGHAAFGVNYENVGYYSSKTDKLNSFQLILIDRSDTGAGNFDIEFNYDKVQWEVGDVSSDVEGGTDGVCGALPIADCTPAAVGYSNGTGNPGTNFQLAGSFVAGALLDNGPAATSLIKTGLNSGVLGRSVFQVRNGAVQSADLGLTMAQSANPVPAGSNQTYTLAVTNAGPSDATNTIVSDTLPTNATLVTATGSQGAACTGTTVVTCNLGTVANAGHATVTVVVTVNAGATGTVVNTATVISDLPDPNQPNNTASVTATIGASTNPTLTITPGGNGAGTVTSNSGGINCNLNGTGTPTGTCSASFASGTVVGLTATPSDGSTFAGWRGGGCSGTGGCSVTITASESVTATFNTSTGATVTVSPTSLTFSSQTVGTTSAPLTVTVRNTGTTVVNFAGFAITGTNSADFGVPLPNSPAMCNPLQGTLAAGASCTISVLFTPTATGTRAAALNIADNATGSPQTVTLTGTGTSASVAVTVTPSSLTFASQSLNSTSAPLTVTVKNTGTGTVNFTGFTIIGANSSEFALGSGSNAGTCNPSGTLAASANCTINVLFTPTATGTRTATLNIADNATGSPQTVALTGTGVSSPVTIGLAPGSPSTVPTTPGSSAVFGLTLTALPGTTGTVTLGCVVDSPTNAADISCNIVPSKITLTGTAINVAIVVNTFCKGAVPGFGPSIPGGLPGGLAMLLASLSLCGAVFTFKRRPRLALSFGVLVLIAVGMSACSNLPKSPGGQATPPGLYPLIVTATAPNGAVSSVNLTLKVLP